MVMAREGRSIGVWTLTIFLSAVFLVAGIPKLIGLPSPIIQAAAMRGFPEWVRLLVGLVETVGALLLLVPAFAAYAAAALALLMLPATVTQLISGEPGAWVPALLFVLLLLVAWARSPQAARDLRHEVFEVGHPMVREGVIAGVIGATVVALWFLLVDIVTGQPLFTPATLGRALLTVLGPAQGGETVLGAVVVYTLVHYAAFLAAGMIAVAVVHAAETEPSVLAGFLILFVVFELAFHGFVALLQQTTSLGALAWYQVLAGNLLAATAMGTYLWRTHPALREELRHAMDWSE
jgi:putative oxidoreductase